MNIIEIFVVIFAIFALSRIILRMREKAISYKMATFWLILWTIIIIFAFFPQISDKFAEYIGIGRGTDTAFFISILLLFYLMFRLYVKINMIDKDITELTIEISKKFQKNNKENNK